jgi:hypothetical protein
MLVIAGQGLTATAPSAADEAWSPLQEATGHTLAVALDDGSTALISVGGPDESTVLDQRRAADGTLGATTEVMTVDDAEACRPVDAASAIGDFAVAVECRMRTELEEPPTILAELVWTGDDGWVWHVQHDAVLGSVDHSPQGQYVLFATNSEYGRPHHLTSYHADLGWRDLTRREVGPTGDDMVAAITDSGNVVTLRGAGFEDEPGYWFGGRLRIETYGDRTGTWSKRSTRSYPDGGIDPAAIDVAAGRVTATVVESRSTGRLRGREDRVVILSGAPDAPRSWSSPRWSPQVLTASAATTQAGVGVASWHAVGRERTAGPWLATWAPGRRQPTLVGRRGRTTLTDAADAGRAMDLSVSANGQGVVAHVRHQRGADHSSVAVESFRVRRDGGVDGQARVTWQQPVATTVDVTASEHSATITLSEMTGAFVTSPLTRYAVSP